MDLTRPDRPTAKEVVRFLGYCSTRAADRVELHHAQLNRSASDQLLITDDVTVDDALKSIRARPPEGTGTHEVSRGGARGAAASAALLGPAPWATPDRNTFLMRRRPGLRLSVPFFPDSA